MNENIRPTPHEIDEAGQFNTRIIDMEGRVPTFKYDRDIWPEPIQLPFVPFLGIDCVSIPSKQIPFDTKLFNGKQLFITNDTGDELMYDPEKDTYVLVTNEAGRFLSNWFCKWRIK